MSVHPDKDPFALAVSAFIGVALMASVLLAGIGFSHGYRWTTAAVCVPLIASLFLLSLFAKVSRHRWAANLSARDLLFYALFCAACFTLVSVRFRPGMDP